jgi:hypothetical protein
MKKLSVAAMLITFITFVPSNNYAQTVVECPKIKQLEETSIKDKDELLNALRIIVPNTYEKDEYGELFSEWEILTALPFPKTVGQENNEVYYEMAKNFCGEAVANKSWLVRLYFPKWEGKSASASEGQLFLSKSKEKGWFVWFRYH